MPLLRVRFNVNADDYRPVKFPPPYPYWCTGHSVVGDQERAIIVAYADSLEQINEFWPDAQDHDDEPRDKIVFTDRFAKPDWWQEPTAN